MNELPREDEEKLQIRLLLRYEDVTRKKMTSCTSFEQHVRIDC
jgi:hypothetical protein